MRFTHTQTFSISAREVVDAYSSPALYSTFAGLDHIGPPEVVEHRIEGDNSVYLQVRYRYTGDLPAGASAFVSGSDISVLETSTTNVTAMRSSFDLSTALGGQFRGSGQSVTTDNPSGGATRVMSGELKVGIPFVGKKVERVIVTGLADSLASQIPLIEAWVDKLG